MLHQKCNANKLSITFWEILVRDKTTKTRRKQSVLWGSRKCLHHTTTSGSGFRLVVDLLHSMVYDKSSQWSLGHTSRRLLASSWRWRRKTTWTRAARCPESSSSASWRRTWCPRQTGRVRCALPWRRTSCQSWCDSARRCCATPRPRRECCAVALCGRWGTDAGTLAARRRDLQVYAPSLSDHQTIPVQTGKQTTDCYKHDASFIYLSV